MGNCLVTKLKGTVDADLPIFGKLVIRNIAIGASDGIVRKLGAVDDNGNNISAYLIIKSGNPYFVKDGQNVGTTVDNSYSGYDTISSQDNAVCDLVLNTKYNIRTLVSYALTVDFNELKYGNTLQRIEIYSGIVKNLSKIDYSLINYFRVVTTEADFNLSYLNGTTTLADFRFDGNLAGDIANISGNTNLETFVMPTDSKNKVVGNINAFANTKIKSLSFNNSAAEVYGDLSTLPVTCYEATFAGVAKNNLFTWNGTKDGYRLAITMGNSQCALNGTDLDAMLTNQSTLNSTTNGYRNISVRTSPTTTPTVAQSVIDTIKTKGINYVTIDGIDY